MFDSMQVQIYVGTSVTAEGWPAEVIAAVYPGVHYLNIGGPAAIVRCPFLFRYDQLIAGSNLDSSHTNAQAFLIKEFEARLVTDLVGPMPLNSYLANGGLLPWEDDDPELDCSDCSYIPSWLSYVYVRPPENPLAIVIGRREEEPRKITGAVYRGRFDAEANCWGSIVDCPVLTHPLVKIFGIDGAQAEELSVQFIRTLFEHHGYKIIETSDSHDAP
jgi:hypothetical protein